MFINNNLLKLFYSALLSGLPSISYNPINQNTLHAPFIVNEGSTYVNYKLDNEQFNKINDYLSKKISGLRIFTCPVHSLINFPAPITELKACGA